MGLYTKRKNTMVMEYKIISDTNYQKVEADVTLLLMDGWKLHGKLQIPVLIGNFTNNSVISAELRYIQALKRTIKTDNTPDTRIQEGDTGQSQGG